MIWPSRRRKKKQPPVTIQFSNAVMKSPGGFVTPTWSTSTSTGYTYGATGATGVTSPYYVTAYPSMAEPEPEPELKDMGLAIEPIVGLRGYRIDPETMTLVSFNGVGWPQREPLYALCGDNPFADHDVPNEDCQCGVYAWNVDMKNNVTGLFGEVYLWGDVLVCPSGYRAEIAYPKNLTIQARKTRAALRIRDGLEEAYGVPVTIIDPDADVPDVTGFSGSNPVLGS